MFTTLSQVLMAEIIEETQIGVIKFVCPKCKSSVMISRKLNSDFVPSCLKCKIEMKKDKGE